MLSIRTQDRMALVPYDSRLSIECNHYKVANKEEIDKVKKENKNLKEKLIYEARNENTNLGKNLGLLTLDKRYEEQKQEEPKEEYYEWDIKSNGESDYGILGTYATKDRALEVLDEIQDTINDTKLLELEYQLALEQGSYTYAKQLLTKNIKYIYNMPKE